MTGQTYDMHDGGAARPHLAAAALTVATRNAGEVLAGSLGTFLRTLGACFARWQRQRAVSRTRAALGELESWVLHDIGVDRGDLARVAEQAVDEYRRHRW